MGPLLPPHASVPKFWALLQSRRCCVAGIVYFAATPELYPGTMRNFLATAIFVIVACAAASSATAGGLRTGAIVAGACSSTPFTVLTAPATALRLPDDTTCVYMCRYLIQLYHSKFLCWSGCPLSPWRGAVRVAWRGCAVLTEHPAVALWRIGGVPSPLFPQDCLVHCTGEASCSGADVVCAAGTACAVQCLGAGSCHGASIDCGSAKSCDIACNAGDACNDGAISNCEKGVCVVECYGGNSCQDVGCTGSGCHKFASRA